MRPHKKQSISRERLAERYKREEKGKNHEIAVSGRHAVTQKKKKRTVENHKECWRSNRDPTTIQVEKR